MKDKEIIKFMKKEVDELCSLLNVDCENRCEMEEGEEGVKYIKVYFDGEAESVSAESATGPFDILPKHHNFITLLEPCDVIVRTGRGDQTIRIAGGMMHVKADDVVVFLDI